MQFIAAAKYGQFVDSTSRYSSVVQNEEKQSPRFSCRTISQTSRDWLQSGELEGREALREVYQFTSHVRWRGLACPNSAFHFTFVKSEIKSI